MSVLPKVTGFHYTITARSKLLLQEPASGNPSIRPVIQLESMWLQYPNQKGVQPFQLSCTTFLYEVWITSFQRISPLGPKLHAPNGNGQLQIILGKLNKV